jgi:hypothetical protein
VEVRHARDVQGTDAVGPHGSAQLVENAGQVDSARGTDVKSTHTGAQLCGRQIRTWSHVILVEGSNG